MSGQTLTTSDGTWSGTAPFTYSYLWRRCDSAGNNCQTIAGATGQTRTLVSADVGSKVYAEVQATNSVGLGVASDLSERDGCSVLGIASTSPARQPARSGLLLYPSISGCWKSSPLRWLCLDVC